MVKWSTTKIQCFSDLPTKPLKVFGCICNSEKEVEILLAKIDSRVLATIEKTTNTFASIEENFGIEAQVYADIYLQHGYNRDTGCFTNCW